MKNDENGLRAIAGAVSLILAISLLTWAVFVYAGNSPAAADTKSATEEAEAVEVSLRDNYPNGCGELNEKDELTGNLTYSISGGTLTIEGEGKMGDIMGPQPWEDVRDGVNKIVIGDGVTYIGFGAFRYFHNITSVTIPANVKAIGAFAFQDCDKLTEVHIEAGEIGEAAFIECANLERVYIGKGVTAIGVSAFESCPNIKGVYINDVAAWCSIYFGGNNSNPLEQNMKDGGNHIYLNGEEIIDIAIPDGMTRVGDYAFYCAKHIKSVSIPDSVKEIGEYAFFRNESLERVTGAASVTAIGAQAFEGDIKLTQMPFHSSLSYIGPFAFRYAPIEKVTMHSGEIGRYAFDGCGELTEVSLGSGVRIGENAFRNCPKSIPSNVTESRTIVNMGRWGDQDIEWLVLDVKDGKALLMSKHILQFIKYHSYGSPMKSKFTWKDSNLRTWLNDTFYQSAFSASEKKKIVTTAVYDDENPVFGTQGGTYSVNRLYVLSATELNQYFRNNEDRMASRIPSAHSINPNTNKSDSAEEHPYLNTSYYWVRTPGMFDYSQCYVHYTGKILYDGQSKSNWIVGVRPAMWVDAESVGIKDNTNLVTAFVTRLYKLCLNRDPDTNGLDAWVTMLKSGDKTAAQVVFGFFMSDEMKNLKLDDGMFIDRCYRVMMDRDADSSGKESWLNVLADGVSRTYLVRGFVRSDEFTTICDKYGLVKGDISVKEARDQRYGVTSYVTVCYTQALGRSFDIDGLNYWTSKILIGPDNRAVAIATAKEGFLHSKEFLDKNLNDTEFCKVLYRVFLGREADAAGLASWTDRLSSGSSRDSVINGFAYSPEFTMLLKKYGL